MHPAASTMTIFFSPLTTDYLCSARQFPKILDPQKNERTGGGRISCISPLTTVVWCPVPKMQKPRQVPPPSCTNADIMSYETRFDIYCSHWHECH